MVVTNRMAIVGLIEVLDCNPNGDLDNENRPRIYDETGVGFITGVCIKRLIRNAAEGMGRRILMKKGTGFNEEIRKEELESLRVEVLEENPEAPKDKKKGKTKSDKREENLKIKQIIRELVQTFWDVKNFGLVTTGDIGTALGESITGVWHVSNVCPSTNPVETLEYPITRCFGSDDKEVGKNQKIGHNTIVKRGFYKVVFDLNYNLAVQMGYTLDDAQDFLNVLKVIFTDGTYGVSKFGMSWVDLRLVQPPEGRDMWYSLGELRRMTEIDWNYEKKNWALPVPANENILVGTNLKP